MSQAEPRRHNPGADPVKRAQALREYIFSQPSEKFLGKPWDLLKTIENFANTEGLPMILRGKKIEIIREELAAQSPKPKIIVEYGTFVGMSTIAWGACLQEVNPDATGLHVYSFEMHSDRAAVARDLIKLVGLEHIITVLEGPGTESLKSLIADGKIQPRSVDMVFLDHAKELYKPDIIACEELDVFHVGSFVAADNVDNPGAPDYAAYVEKGGSGQQGAVCYKTKSIEAAEEHGPKLVVISTVISVE